MGKIRVRKSKSLKVDRSEICKVKPSPYDARDWQFEAFKRGRRAISSSETPLPATYLCTGLPPIKNQGSRGTCVAMSLSAMKEFQENHDNPLPNSKSYVMSPNSVYFYRGVESGMYCRSAMQILQTYGICNEKLFPYSKTEEPKTIPEEAVKEATNYVIKSYAQVTTIEGAKQAIIEYGPLLIAFPYYSNGLAEFWIKPSVNAEVAGGHAVSVIGWNEKGFVLRNSWGASWNLNGQVVYPFEQWGSHWEIWSSIDEETNYVPQPEPEPKPEPRTGCFSLCRK